MALPISCRASRARNYEQSRDGITLRWRLPGRRLQSLGDLLLGRLQHLLSVHVLPPSVADIDCTHFIIACHQPNSVSKAAIVSRAFRLRPLERVEDLQRTNEQAGINRIVMF